MRRLGPDGRLQCPLWPRMSAVSDIAAQLEREDPEMFRCVRELEADLWAQYAARTRTVSK